VSCLWTLKLRAVNFNSSYGVLVKFIKRVLEFERVDVFGSEDSSLVQSDVVT
jgi:hypothetical protein